MDVRGAEGDLNFDMKSGKCRSCLLSPDTLLRLSAAHVSMIFACTGLQISAGDGFICKKCTDDLVTSYMFKIRFLESDSVLKSKIPHVTVDPQYLTVDVDPSTVDAYLSLDTDSENDVSKNDELGTEDEDSPGSNTEFSSIRKEGEGDEAKNSTANYLTFDYANESSNKISIDEQHRDMKKVNNVNYLKDVENGDDEMMASNDNDDNTNMNNHKRNQEEISSISTNTSIKTDKKKKLTNARRHACDVCSRTFTQLKYLKMHSRKHFGTAQKCDNCSFSSAHPGGLKRHMESHKNTFKMLSCPVCKLSCNTKDSLGRHFKIHGRTWPNKCRSCSKMCENLMVLHDHIKTCHADEDNAEAHEKEKIQNIEENDSNCSIVE